MNLLMWVSGSSVHVLMAPRLVCHIKEYAEPPPKVVKKCPIEKTDDMSNEDW